MRQSLYVDARRASPAQDVASGVPVGVRLVNDGTLEEWRRLARQVAFELGSAEGGLRGHPERFGAVLAGTP